MKLDAGNAAPCIKTNKNSKHTHIYMCVFAVLDRYIYIYVDFTFIAQNSHTLHRLVLLHRKCNEQGYLYCIFLT